MSSVSNPLNWLRREYYFRKAYVKFEDAAVTVRKEDSFSPRKTEASDRIEESMELIDKALDGEPSETSEFEAGMYFAILTNQDFEPVEYRKFKKYFEDLEDL